MGRSPTRAAMLVAASLPNATTPTIGSDGPKGAAKLPFALDRFGSIAPLRFLILQTFDQLFMLIGVPDLWSPLETSFATLATSSSVWCASRLVHSKREFGGREWSAASEVLL